MDATIPRLLTIYDVADWLHMPAQRVRRMARQGKLPYITSPDGEILFPEPDLIAWVNAQRGTSEEVPHAG